MTIGQAVAGTPESFGHEFVQACQHMGVIPHVAQNTSGRRSAVPDAIAASEGYALSQRKRKLIEQGFGWAKTVGGIRQVMVRGLKRVDHLFVLTMTAYNLTRMRSLGQIRPQGALRQSEARKTPSNQRKRLPKSLLTALYEKRIFAEEDDWLWRGVLPHPASSGNHVQMQSSPATRVTKPRGLVAAP